ncbi:MAG: sigma-70 family RNA polymerase sigma factor, partial [Microthrixaceae bacterium]
SPVRNGRDAEQQAELDRRSRELFERYTRSRAVGIRNELVVLHLDIASAMARRFAGRGEPMEDLEQVARFALVRAVERFDPDRGVPFIGFAIPTILGELKRHFRDRTWSGSVRRAVKELLPRVRAAAEELDGKLGHPANPREVAEHLGVSVEEVIEALEAGRWYRATSLSRPGPNGGEGLSSTLTSDDNSIQMSTDRMFLSSLLGRLDEREQHIVLSRFVNDMSQEQIAREIGISQMHVSRLLRKALAKLGEMVDEESIEDEDEDGHDGQGPFEAGAIEREEL